jgi:hypothetical protein
VNKSQSVTEANFISEWVYNQNDCSGKIIFKLSLGFLKGVF